MKYGIRDYRGGGRSSARETAMRVAAGAIARKVVPGWSCAARWCRWARTDVARLDAAAIDARADPQLRQAAVWALGRSGRQDAAGRLVAPLTVEGDEVGRFAASALADLSGLAHGTDAARWTAWWDAHKDLAEADWLQGRLAFQAARSGRLDGELLRAAPRRWACINRFSLVSPRRSESITFKVCSIRTSRAFAAWRSSGASKCCRRPTPTVKHRLGKSSSA